MNPFDAVLPALQQAEARAHAAPVVQLRDISKRYGNVQALDRVSLTVPAGQVVALLGPNGAGKSTLVEIIMGLRKADSGTASVFSSDLMRGDRSYLARLGVQLQSTAFFHGMTGRDYLKLFEGLYPNNAGIERVIEALNLTAFADRRIRELSGGQRQRIALALAIINDPEFIILDEPTVGLDPIARREFWEIIRRLHGGSKTLLFSTHYMEEVESLASHVVMMANGRVTAAGTIAEVIAAAPGARNLDDAYNILLSQRKGDSQ